MGNRVNRAFVMLASPFVKGKHRVGGMFCSEKLDGYRGVWIPAARGINVNDLPFANLEKKKKLVVATGLFTRYGNVVHAPNYFLDALPTDRCLDGELWMGRQSFQRTMSVCKKEPENRSESDWQKVKYYIFDSPCYGSLFESGRINDTNFKKDISQKACLEALKVEPGTPLPFEFMYNTLKKQCVDIDGVDCFNGAKHLVLHKQELLPFKTTSADERLEELLLSVTDDGGEGVILRHPAWAWEPIRSGFMNKYKLEQDAEAKVIGYIAGKEGKEGKHLGRLGSLRMAFNGLVFDMGGFTDDERELTSEGREWAYANPGEDTKEPVSVNFPLGAILTFKYRELTNSGVPKEGRYFRKHQT